jgi:hypothetical protein
MRGDDDDFRRQAADAEKQAQAARSDVDRQAWLRISQGWMSLLRKRPQSDEDAFEAKSSAVKTTDKDSDSSH